MKISQKMVLILKNDLKPLLIGQPHRRKIWCAIDENVCVKVRENTHTCNAAQFNMHACIF